MGLFDRFRKRSNGSDSPSISEQPVSDENLYLIRGCARDCATELQLDMAAMSPEELVGAVNDFIVSWQNSHVENKALHPAPESPFEHHPLILGSLWAEQLVAVLNWEWATIVFHEHGASQALGVVSPDRSLMICPFHFVYGCMANLAQVKIMLSFNMLTEAKEQPPIPPNSYANVMEHVQFIVPPSPPGGWDKSEQ